MSKKHNKKNNMKQAMYEMFGVGEEQTNAVDQTVQDEAALEELVGELTVEIAIDEKEETDVVSDEMCSGYEVEKKLPVSYFAPGTVFEGTLKSRGDVEIAGEFNGDVKAEGKVILKSVVRGNVSAKELELTGCTLEGDIVVKDATAVGEDSRVSGNIKTGTIWCAGQITGDITAAEDTALESTAVVTGIITTGTMSMVKGAVINGGIEMNVKGHDK